MMKHFKDPEIFTQHLGYFTVQVDINQGCQSPQPLRLFLKFNKISPFFPTTPFLPITVNFSSNPAKAGVSNSKLLQSIISPPVGTPDVNNK